MPLDVFVFEKTSAPEENSKNPRILNPSNSVDHHIIVSFGALKGLASSLEGILRVVVWQSSQDPDRIFAQ